MKIYRFVDSPKQEALSVRDRSFAPNPHRKHSRGIRGSGARHVDVEDLHSAKTAARAKDRLRVLAKKAKQQRLRGGNKRVAKGKQFSKKELVSGWATRGEEVDDFLLSRKEENKLLQRHLENKSANEAARYQKQSRRAQNFFAQNMVKSTKRIVPADVKHLTSAVARFTRTGKLTEGVYLISDANNLPLESRKHATKFFDRLKKNISQPGFTIIVSAEKYVVEKNPGPDWDMLRVAALLAAKERNYVEARRLMNLAERARAVSLLNMLIEKNPGPWSLTAQTDSNCPLICELLHRGQVSIMSSRGGKEYSFRCVHCKQPVKPFTSLAQSEIIHRTRYIHKGVTAVDSSTITESATASTPSPSVGELSSIAVSNGQVEICTAPHMEEQATCTSSSQVRAPCSSAEEIRAVFHVTQVALEDPPPSPETHGSAPPGPEPERPATPPPPEEEDDEEVFIDATDAPLDGRRLDESEVEDVLLHKCKQRYSTWMRRFFIDWIPKDYVKPLCTFTEYTTVETLQSDNRLVSARNVRLTKQPIVLSHLQVQMGFQLPHWAKYACPFAGCLIGYLSSQYILRSLPGLIPDWIKFYFLPLTLTFKGLAKIDANPINLSTIYHYASILPSALLGLVGALLPRCHQTVSLTYAPHAVSELLADSGRAVSTTTSEANLPVQYRRLATLPIADVISENVRQGSIDAAQVLLSKGPFFTQSAPVGHWTSGPPIARFTPQVRVFPRRV